jgi:hypothetical protein
MICQADGGRVPGRKSRAMMLPRLQPRCFMTWWWKWFIVRPGLIRGMVHPYLKIGYCANGYNRS